MHLKTVNLVMLMNNENNRVSLMKNQCGGLCLITPIWKDISNVYLNITYLSSVAGMLLTCCCKLAGYLPAFARQTLPSGGHSRE